MSLQVIDKSFGFDTSVEEAQRAINAAHVEATSIENCIGLVKLMGRNSGKHHPSVRNILKYLKCFVFIWLAEPTYCHVIMQERYDKTIC